MKRFFRKIHLWLSVPFGVIITLICFSGAMLVFEKEMTRLCYADIYKVENGGGRPLPLNILAAKVSSTLPDGVEVTGITVSSDPTEAYKANLSKPRRAAVYINQYTGAVTGKYERPAFFATMFSLHRWLMDSGRPEGRPAYGKIIVGISTIMFVISLISGVCVWWPKTRRSLAGSMKITTGKGRFRLWRSLHVAGGMYVITLLLAMALTGLTWSFSWYNKAFYAALGIEAPVRGGGNDKQKSGDKNKGARNGRADKKQKDGSNAASTKFARWQQVYDRLRTENPHAAQITVGDGTASVTPSKFGNTRASDRYTFCTSTGRITSAVKYADATPQGKVRGWIYSVHAGTFGGYATRVLWFLAALLGASLPLTGYYLWIRRLVRTKR